MPVLPCPVCGYDNPGPGCPHCGLAPREESLAPSRGTVGALWAGLAALPRGFHYLVTNRGIKRWMLPPVLATCIVFAVVFTWAYGAFRTLVDALVPGAVELDWDEGWLRATVEWFLNEGPGLLLLKLGSWLVFAVVFSLASWYCFSIAFEAIAGPFLDEIHGRLESRWFGYDPRTELQRPNAIPVARCMRLSLVAGAAALILAGLAWWLGPWWSALLVVPIPFVVAGRVDREYGEWLAWVGTLEGRALLVGIQVSLVTAVLLVLALPLYLVPIPFVGHFLYATVAGFCTALALTDLAFERRQWPLRMRLAFVGLHFVPLTAFGATSGILFAVPIVGPLLVVPAASIGALWLVCKLDKNALRPADQRIAARSAQPALPAQPAQPTQPTQSTESTQPAQPAQKGTPAPRNRGAGV